ncbi:hypothetical protein OG871_28720 [Kitasatospora sp. NBC_00374]|uniref:hypothetical protein n=1 Tax=Kitasatospora sp. NBC_00374 TaxID=2975964 RepID=UPI0032431851
MIVVTTATASAAVLVGPEGEYTRIRSLAQRAMVRSATESFEHLRLSPGAEHEHPGRADSESAWFVLRGPVLAEQLPHAAHHLAAEGDLLLAPAGRGLRLRAGPLGAELLCLALRTPVAPRRPRRRTGGRVRP